MSRASRARRAPPATTARKRAASANVEVLVTHSSRAQRKSGGRRGSRRFGGRVSKQTREWLFATTILAGLLIAVVVILRVSGSKATPSASTANAQQKGAPGVFQSSGIQASAIQAAVANTLGISTTTLSGDLQAGKTVAQITSTQHVALATVNNAYLAAVKQQTTQAVSNGALTQTQADQIYSQQQQQIQSGQYPFLQNSPAELATVAP